MMTIMMTKKNMMTMIMMMIMMIMTRLAGVLSFCRGGYLGCPVPPTLPIHVHPMMMRMTIENMMTLMKNEE